MGLWERWSNWVDVWFQVLVFKYLFSESFQKCSRTILNVVSQCFKTFKRFKTYHRNEPSRIYKLESYTPTRANRGTNLRPHVATVVQNNNTQRNVPDIHQKAKSILTKFAPQFRSAIYNQHSTFETEKYTQQSNENEELIAKCFITIKESMSLANQSESSANFYHIKIGQNLCFLQEKLEQQPQRFINMLRDDFGISKRYVSYILFPWPHRMFQKTSNRTLRRYKLYYNFLQEFPRFKHSSVSFRELRDRIHCLRAWLDSDNCVGLPSTDVISRSFWKCEPTTF